PIAPARHAAQRSSSARIAFQVGSERAKPGECQPSGAELLLRRRETQPKAAEGGSLMAIKTMDDLFIHALQDVYYAENQVAKAIPEMMEKVTDSSLFDHLQRHLD